ncbi:hypothetical protein CLAUR_027340 [Clostridium felsineum]|nr:hypothetical protein CLAUR_027340 [Clostridium felsineum]
MKEKPNFVEKLSQDVAIKLNKHLKKEGIELVKLKFGLEVIFINLTSLI